MSRKKTTIDWKFVDDALEKLCDGTEIAAALGITEDTLYNHVKQTFKMDFSVYKAQKRSKTLKYLRVVQLKMAENNPAMAIFLGKNYLNQSDKQELNHTGAIGITFVEKLAE